jgi:Flp pilus assembly protein TadG
MKITKRKFNEKGAAVVEFAVVVPLLLVLVFGIIEFGILLYNKAMLTNASREGARAGIVMRVSEPRWSTAEITDVVKSYCEEYLITFDPAKPSPTVKILIKTPADTDPVERDPSSFGLDSAVDLLTVKVQYQYQFLLIPAFIKEIGATKTLEANTTMRAE